MAQAIATAKVQDSSQEQDRINTLVCQITDGFLRGDETRSASDVRPFEELLGNLLPQSDIFTRCVVAQKLCARSDVPRSIIATLLNDNSTICEPLVFHSKLITEDDITKLMARRDPILRSALLAREDLSLVQRQALLLNIPVAAVEPQKDVVSPMQQLLANIKPLMIVAPANEDEDAPRYIDIPQLRAAPERSEWRNQIAPEASAARRAAEWRNQIAPERSERRNQIAPERSEWRNQIAPERSEWRNQIAPKHSARGGADGGLPNGSINDAEWRQSTAGTGTFVAAAVASSPRAPIIIDIPLLSASAIATAQDPATDDIAPVLSSDQVELQHMFKPSRQRPRADQLVANIVRLAVLRQSDALAAVIASELDIAQVITKALLKDSSGEALVTACRHMNMSEDASMQVATLLYPALTRTREQLTGLRTLYRNFTDDATARIVSAWRDLGLAAKPAHETVNAPVKAEPRTARVEPSRKTIAAQITTNAV